MLPFNTMRYATDVFYFTEPTPTTALLRALVALDLSNCSGIKSISISGIEPYGTSRRFMFVINNTAYKIVNGALSTYSGALTIDNVLADGNTAADLTALDESSLTTMFLNKAIYPVIALRAPASALAPPSVKFAFNVLTIA